MKTHLHNTVIALDVGERRVGVALAHLQSRLPAPLTTLQHDASIAETVQKLVDEHAAKSVVVGLPRGLDGQHTAQTRAIEAFKAELEQHLTVPVYWQDEAVTSRQAEDELKSRGKPYKKEDIDALSATYILEDFMREHPEGRE